MSRGPIWLFAALLAVSGCGGTSPYAIQSDIEAGNLEGAAQKLEQRRDGDPDDFDTRLILADVYYQMARKALDQDDQAAYLANLAKAQAEILEAVRIDPDSPRPHTWLGIITAYQGELDQSAISFKNALRLNLRERMELRGGTYYSNIAHISVYQGKLGEARRYLDKGAKNGAPQDEIDRISVLASWKSNDMVEARDIFNSAVVLSPAFAASWDGAPLPQPMKTFDDFTAVCCRNPTCGPHMEGACKRSGQAVARRSLDLDTLEQERKLELARQQKLREIYKRRKDITITTEEEAPGAPAPSGSSPKR